MFYPSNIGLLEKLSKIKLEQKFIKKELDFEYSIIKTDYRKIALIQNRLVTLSNNISKLNENLKFHKVLKFKTLDGFKFCISYDIRKTIKELKQQIITNFNNYHDSITLLYINKSNKSSTQILDNDLNIIDYSIDYNKYIFILSDIKKNN